MAPGTALAIFADLGWVAVVVLVRRLVLGPDAGSREALPHSAFCVRCVEGPLAAGDHTIPRAKSPPPWRSSPTISTDDDQRISIR